MRLCEHDGTAAKKGSGDVADRGIGSGFLAAVPDEQRRQDAQRLCAMMQQITGQPPVLWGTSIIGFGTYHYRYASGREGDAPLASFSPRRLHCRRLLQRRQRHRADFGRALGRH